MLFEDGKYYIVLKAIPYSAEEQEESPYTHAEWVYGRYGLEHRDAVLYEYLKNEQIKLRGILTRLEQECDGKEMLPDKTANRLARS